MVNKRGCVSRAFSYERKREQYLKQGLCSRCGKKRDNEFLRLCEMCRDKSKESYWRRKISVKIRLKKELLISEKN